MAKAFSRTKLANYVARELEAGADADIMAKKIAGYLIDNGKSSELNSLMRDVMEIRAAKNGLVELETSSAFELNADEEAQINRIAKQHYAGSKDVIIHHHKDPRSIGGVEVSLPHSRLDLRVRTKLNRLRSAIAK